MKTEVKRVAQRASALFTAFVLGTGMTVTSLLLPQTASAITSQGAQLTSRAIYLSKSTPSATASYLVTFKPTVTTALKGIIVDFCAGSPIVGDSTCVKPAGFDLTVSPSITYTAQTAGTNSPITTSSITGTGSWAATGLNNASGYRTLKLANNTGSSGALTTANTYGFIINGVTNPSQATPATSGTFYARIITYDLDTGEMASYAPGTEGTSADVIDYGGVALSTAYDISITAKVQESLTFCTSALDLSASSRNCTNATTPTLTLGHGTPAVLTNTQVDTATAYTQASTNATSGLVIRMHAINACSNGGLSTDGGTTCGITGNGATAAAAITAGTTAFGLFVSSSSLTTGVSSSTGTITPDGNYWNTSHTNEGTGDLWYGMDTTANSGVTSTYGDQIASSSAPVSQVNNHIVFGATAGLTVPAGIYTGSESLIATGTF